MSIFLFRVPVQPHRNVLVNLVSDGLVKIIVVQ